MTNQEIFDSLTLEQRIKLLDNYEWGIRLNRIWEHIMKKSWEEYLWTFFVVFVKDKKKNINIWYDKNPEQAIVKASYKLWANGWFSEEQMNAVIGEQK